MHLSYLANSHFCNYKLSPRILRQYRVLRNLRKNKYIEGIEEINLDTSKFEELNEDPSLKREASLQRFLSKLKQKQFFNEIEYDKLYPSGSAPVPVPALWYS